MTQLGLRDWVLQVLHLFILILSRYSVKRSTQSRHDTHLNEVCAVITMANYEYFLTVHCSLVTRLAKGIVMFAESILNVRSGKCLPDD